MSAEGAEEGVVSETRTCAACSKDLPLGNFAPIKSKPGRRLKKCRDCMAAYMRDWHARHPGYARQKFVEWTTANAQRWQRVLERQGARPPRPPNSAAAWARLRREVASATGGKVLSRTNDGVKKIYFVQEGEAGPVKIGWTQQDLVARLNQIQNGNPRPVRLIGLLVVDSPVQAEEALHAHFADWHIRGEWYEPGPSLMEFIAEVARLPEPPPPRKAASGYRGVWSHRGRHMARLHVGGRHLYLGTFDTPEEAARAYDEAAREQFGAGAVLNFPDKGTRDQAC